MKRKSILKALLLTVLMCCLTFALVACGGKHTVTFNYGVDGNGDGEVDVVTVEVGDGSLLEEPTDVPTRDGYTFVGWGTDNGMWNFEEDTVTSDLTLTARWSAGDPVDPGTPGTTVYVNYALGIGAADSASDSDSDPSFVPNRWSGAPGTTIKLPPAPAAAAGWEFTGWLVEKETELRAAGSDYTVTGTVTITAQWKSVAYTQYTWQVTTPPSDSAAGVATGTPVVGGGKDITVELPAFPADESYAEYPTAGKYNVETADATCTKSATETLYYTIPQTQTYESYKLLIDVQSIPGEPATGHLYTTWIVTNPSATAEGTATATCANGCGKTLTITLPEITGNTGSGEGKYTEKAVQQQLSCEKDGIVDYVYTIPASDLADGDAADAAEGTVKELSFTVTTPATGHKITVNVTPATETDTNTVTTATLTATCANSGCDKGWDEDANPANATVTFNLGDGKVQDGVTLTDADVKFDPETPQFTVTLPGKDKMTLAQNIVLTGWTVNGTNYAAGDKISVAAGGTIDVTGNFMEHTHNYGGITFETLGTYAGMFVKKCDVDDCPEPTVVVASASDDDISVTLKNQVYIGGEIEVDDFTVTVTYKYQIAWGNDSVGDTHLTITLGDAEDETYQSYFSNNLGTLSTAAWASGLQATFEFKVGSNTVASGTATFDVVPAADAIFGTETDVKLLYQNTNPVSGMTIAADKLTTGGYTVSNGISVSFWLSEFVANDWTARVISGGTNNKLHITVANLDWFEDDDNLNGQNAFPQNDTANGGGKIYTSAPMTNSVYYITISIVNDSVILYKNGVKFVEYSDNDDNTVNDKEIAAFANTLLTSIQSKGFVFANGNGITVKTSDLLITSLLNDENATKLWKWYSENYPMTTDGMVVIGDEAYSLPYLGASPVWEAPVTLESGDKIVVSGTLKSVGQNAWQVPVADLYLPTGKLGLAGFRCDGFIAVDGGFKVTSTPAITNADTNYDTANGGAAANADTAFCAALQTGVTYTLTYDWTDESKIVVTAVFTDGGEMTKTSTFTVTAAADQTLADSYNIGIGGEDIYLRITSVTETISAQS